MGTSSSKNYRIHQSPKWGKDAELEAKAVRTLLKAADTSGDGVLSLEELTVCSPCFTRRFGVRESDLGYFSEIPARPHCLCHQMWCIL